MIYKYKIVIPYHVIPHSAQIRRTIKKRNAYDKKGAMVCHLLFKWNILSGPDTRPDCEYENVCNLYLWPINLEIVCDTLSLIGCIYIWIPATSQLNNWRYRSESKVKCCVWHTLSCNWSLVSNRERLHPKLYMLYSWHDRRCHILAVLLQSHGWTTLKIHVKVKGHYMQPNLSC